MLKTISVQVGEMQVANNGMFWGSTLPDEQIPSFYSPTFIFWYRDEFIDQRFFFNDII